ncbi:hypothetical protein PR048_025672 [Dryococelus australis]|uniref:Decapping nuclease n=1 Tax=Dryococelus australis TaxID=614101 RepID=A0ABQ9GJ87_9NEOP|nr:hypothetical protein PR048_025672 [Dryococelus australis]
MEARDGNNVSSSVTQGKGGEWLQNTGGLPHEAEMPRALAMHVANWEECCRSFQISKVYYGFKVEEPDYLSFQGIEVLGNFSVDGKRNFQADLSQLKYVKVPPHTGNVRYDLNYRLRDVIKKSEEVEKLDNLLKWILNDKRVWKSAGTKQVDECERLKNTRRDTVRNFRCRRGGVLLDGERKGDGIAGHFKMGLTTAVDFVSWRGLLSKILSTPYENFDGWIICASRWKGTIYLCAKETEEQRQKRAQQTEDQKKYMMWGRKFEQYLLADTVDGTPNVDRPVDENEELCVVFGSEASGFNMLYGAEIDGVDSNTQIRSYEDLRKAKFVELKTHRTIQNRSHESNFKR